MVIEDVGQFLHYRSLCDIDRHVIGYGTVHRQ